MGLQWVEAVFEAIWLG